MPTENGSAVHVLLEVHDQLGSTDIVIDHDTGELAERMGYMAYGQADSDYRPARWDSYREDYRFTGKEEDIEVGLEYFGKRFLSPYLGRWMDPDLLSLHSPGLGDLNLFAYVHGLLFRAVDPTGLEEASRSGSTEASSGQPAGNGQSNTADVHVQAPPVGMESKCQEGCRWFTTAPGVNQWDSAKDPGAKAAFEEAAAGHTIYNYDPSYNAQQALKTAKDLATSAGMGGGSGANPSGSAGNVGTQRAAGAFTAMDAAMRALTGPGSRNGKSGGMLFGGCPTCEGSSVLQAAVIGIILDVRKIFSAAESAIRAAGSATRALPAAPAQRLVIGRGADLAKPGALGAGEFKLGWPSKLPDFKAEWKLNSGFLREEMRNLRPIRDASPGDTGGIFLKAERSLLQSRGWTFDAATNLWLPP
jgi:RHS repeat-associated protein